MTDVVLDPHRWQSVEAGDTAVLERWLACEGDHVDRGAPIATVRLVGESVDVVAPHSGIVEQILLSEGERFPAGHVLARMIEF